MNVRKRLLLDAGLSAAIVVEMLYQVTGNMVHEVLGALLGAAVIAHVALSRSWAVSYMKRSGQGLRAKPKARARFYVDVALGAVMVLLMLTSLLISNQLLAAGFDPLQGSSYAYSVLVVAHTLFSYLLCALVLVHLAMHWMVAASACRVKYDPARRQAIGAGVAGVAAFLVCAVTVSGLGAVGRAAESAAAIAGGDDSDDSPTSDQGAGSGSDRNESSAESENSGPDEPADGEGDFYDEGSDGEHGGSSTDGYDDEYLWDGEDSTDSGSDSDSDSSADDGESSDASGTCPLCRKACPLSAPQCNRPYAAGLL